MKTASVLALVPTVAFAATGAPGLNVEEHANIAQGNSFAPKITVDHVNGSSSIAVYNSQSISNNILNKVTAQQFYTNTINFYSSPGSQVYYIKQCYTCNIQEVSKQCNCYYAPPVGCPQCPAQIQQLNVTVPIAPGRNASQSGSVYFPPPAVLPSTTFVQVATNKPLPAAPYQNTSAAAAAGTPTVDVAPGSAATAVGAVPGAAGAPSFSVPFVAPGASSVPGGSVPAIGGAAPAGGAATASAPAGGAPAANTAVSPVQPGSTVAPVSPPLFSSSASQLQMSLAVIAAVAFVAALF